jgi:hypothetical protein
MNGMTFATNLLFVLVIEKFKQEFKELDKRVVEDTVEKVIMILLLCKIEEI